ncbi:MAG: hypothetical protein IT162_12705 [Bryobacterales bacterium]|nr:hypothetical protein [Bryobacterales bacterium]
MLRGLAEPPYFTWLRGLLHMPPPSASLRTDQEADEPQAQFLVRFMSEFPELWRTDSRPRVRRMAERVRQQAGQLLAKGAPASERHLMMQSLQTTLARMAGEMDKFSVVSWWEPIAGELCANAAADPGARELLIATLRRSLRHPNPFIQLSALLALNRMGVATSPDELQINAIDDPASRLNPEMAEWINQLVAGRASYPDPALFW